LLEAISRSPEAVEGLKTAQANALIQAASQDPLTAKRHWKEVQALQAKIAK